MRKKGYLLLTEGRSGSNWLASVADATGVMGRCGEWLGEEYHDRRLARQSPGQAIDAVIRMGSTPDGAFAMKVFPRHLHKARAALGFDVIRRLGDMYDLRVIRLTRRDTLAQAVSFVRGAQTGQWTSDKPARRTPVYDFDSICAAYFYIARSNHYWDAYVALLGLPADHFVYEDLPRDLGPFLSVLSAHFGVEIRRAAETRLKVQRDGLNEEWLARFRDDLLTRDVVAPSGLLRHPMGFSLRNLAKLLRNSPMLIPYETVVRSRAAWVPGDILRRFRRG